MSSMEFVTDLCHGSSSGTYGPKVAAPVSMVPFHLTDVQGWPCGCTHHDGG